MNYRQKKDHYGSLWSDNPKEVEQAIKAGADVNDKNLYGETPLFKATGVTTELLLKAGADPHIRNEDGNTALFFADATKTELLLLRGLDPNQTGKYGDTALFPADPQAARVLLAHGADPNIRNDFGDTPLLFHVHNNHSREEAENKARLLVEHGADLNLRNPEGSTAIDCAPDEFKPFLYSLKADQEKSRLDQTIPKSYQEFEAKIRSEHHHFSQPALSPAERVKTGVNLDQISKTTQPIQKQTQNQTRKLRL